MTKYAVVRIIDEESIKWPEYRERYLIHAQTYQASSTIRSVYMPAMRSFSDFIGAAPLNEITRENCEAWMLALRKKMKPHSMRTKMMAMKSVFNYALNSGLVPKNPFANIKLPPPKFAGRILTDVELSRFLAAIPNESVRRACHLALYCGFRSSEVLNLEWREVFDDRIVIPPEKSKSKRGRVVMLKPKAKELLGVRGTGKVFGFCNLTLLRNVRAGWRQAGVGRIRFHDMRHNWATRFLDKTGDPWAVMDAGGWVNPQSMNPYQHMTKSRQEKIFGVSYTFDG